MEGYEVLVVGAGFAGSEVAYRLARSGRRVLLLTQSLDSLFLPVTPVTEPPAGDTLFAEVFEEGLPPFLLHARAKWRLEAERPRLHLQQATATGLLVEGGRAVGVRTFEGPAFRAPRVVLAVGTFLGARLSVGRLEEAAGRLGEAAYDDLFEDLKGRGFAFLPAEQRAAPYKGAPGYRVRFYRFADDEWEPETFRLPRLEGLYAVGACVSGGTSYRDESESGARLGEALLRELEHPSGEGA